MTYKLRNLSDTTHAYLKEKQLELQRKTGRFYSLERVIYIIINEKKQSET